METAPKRRRMERKIEKLLKSLEKKTYKYIKQNQDKVRALGQALFEKKHLKSSEILSIIG
jgi:ATP-dependent Zn protease